MEEAQVLAIVRDFLERKRLVKTSAVLLQELQSLETPVNGVAKLVPNPSLTAATSIVSQLSLGQDHLGPKLGVLKEVDDEDLQGSSSATSSPQCTANDLISSQNTSEIVTCPIPIAKLHGKSDADKPAGMGPLRRANSYQPPSLLKTHFEGAGMDTKTGMPIQEYVRPKRVSTSTGHQRPALPDAISSVQLGMAQSGFIPILQSSPVHTSNMDATLVGLDSYVSGSGAPLPEHDSPPSNTVTASMSVPVTRTLPANAVFDTSRSTPGTSSLGTNRSRRSRTSSISEETRSHIVMHTAEAPNPNLNPQTTQTTAISTNHASVAAPTEQELQAIMTSPLLASPPSNPISPAGLASLLPPKGSHDEKARESVEKALAGLDLGASASPHTPNSQASLLAASQTGDDHSTPTTDLNGSQHTNDVGIVAVGSTPSSNESKPTNQTSSNSSNADLTALDKLNVKVTSIASSAPAVVTTVKHSTQNTSSVAQAHNSKKVTDSDAQSKGQTTNSNVSSTQLVNTGSHSGTPIAQTMAETMSVGSSHTHSAKSLTETDSFASSSDEQPDEYSDDDDLGYVRISATGGSTRHLVAHLSVFGLDDSSSDSDSLSSDESDLSDSDSDTSDEDDRLRMSKGISKRTGALKRISSKAGHSSSPKLADARAGAKGQSGNDRMLSGSALFHMEDVKSPAKKRPAKVRTPATWTDRPLPADGPTPYLKLPEIPTELPPPTNTDFSMVNVKRSRHENHVQLEYFNMKIIYDRQKTGFEATHDFPIRIGDVIAGRYEIVEYLGSAAFSRAVKCIDHLRGHAVCLKIIKNNKDYFDQSLDEIKLLTLIKHQCASRCDDFHVLELFDYFYFKEHLFLVCELLRENLYEVYKYNRQSGETIYFNIPRLQRVAWQSLLALHFIHSKNLIHCDLKPENILIKSYSRSLIKVIDFGSSCFTSDQLSSYVQSRSYRAPEVVLGYPYDQRIDMWSLGCILAELWTGRVLFQNESLATLIAKHIGIVGVQKSDRQYLKEAPLADDIFTPDGIVYEKKQASTTNGSPTTIEYIQIKKTSIRKRLQTTDPLFFSFVSSLLRINPEERPTSWQAMHHPWFRHVYPDP